MALRTFHSNPSLGGFGGESSARNHVNGDAFAQIIKELVDNAVDACSSATAAGTATTTKQTATSRVRVTIEPLTSISNNSNNNHNNSGDKNKKEGDSIQQSLIGQQLLRISVIDNGIGMENVQKCVDAFQTSKGADSTDPSHTAGRYGIGLTLTLLHAQRLVPNSAAIIQSATAQQDSWTKITCIVDTEGDSVRCIKQELFPKSYPLESGTSVCVLVPGGTYANDVWPRVAEYFGRFKLSVGLCCSLEVLAPTLSKVPLFVRSPAAAASQSAYADHQSQESLNVESDNRALFQGLQDTNESETQNSVATIVATRSSIANDNSEDRVSIWKAAQSYLERPLLLKNVSHSMVPIRFDLKNPNPQLEVNLIVHGLNESSTETASDNDSEMSTRSTSLDNNDTTSDGGTMLLVRLVNKIPLLDCAEAVACGLVQGIAAKKKTWNSFGLDVSLLPNISDSTKRQMYCVRDSEQVAPFFKKGGHELFTASDDESSTDESADESTGIPLGQKRKRPQQRSGLLPAKLRLANILAIVQMHAKPTTLPLPTLSKGRLPIDCREIDEALENGINNCLRQLQKSNPSLLLTVNELRVAERDARYVPAVASALASIICHSRRDGWKTDMINVVKQWPADHNQPPKDDLDEIDDGDLFDTLASNTEAQLRLTLNQPKEKPSNEKSSDKSDSSSELSEYNLVLDQSWQESEPKAKTQRVVASSKDDESTQTMSVERTATDDYEDWL